MSASPKALNLAEKLLQAAKNAGAEQADALAVQSAQSHVSCRMGQPEDLERAESLSLGLRVWMGARVASLSTTDTSDATLASLAEQAVAMARLAPEDPYALLAQESELARGIMPALDLVDEAPEPSIKELQAQAMACEDIARHVPGISNSEGASASFGDTSVALVTSGGFAQSYRGTSHSISVSVLAGEGTAMERDWGHSSARHRADLDTPEQVAKDAAERTLRRLDPRRPNTCSVPVVYEWRVARGFISTIATALSGGAVANGASFLRERMGEKVFSDQVTVTDDALRPRGQASRPFDGEGVASRKLTLIENGVIQSWLLDLRTAKKLNMASTGSATRGMSGPPSPAPTNLTLLAGKDSLEALLADIGTGLLVTEAFGGGVNIVTGDFSQGVSGLWIENGKISHAVSEITIAGKLDQIFASLQPADDLYYRGRINSPSLLLGKLTVAGA